MLVSLFLGDCVYLHSPLNPLENVFICAIEFIPTSVMSICNLDQNGSPVDARNCE